MESFSPDYWKENTDRILLWILIAKDELTH
jgi:hypothetical protein